MIAGMILIAVAHAPDLASTDPTRPLGLAECLRLVVAHNPGVAVDRMDARIGDLTYDSSLHRFGLFLEAGPALTRSISPTDQTVVSGGVSQLQELDQTYKLDVRQDLATGGSLTLGVNNGITDTNSLGVDINPAYAPQASFTFSQPLLRNALTGFQDLDLARMAAQQARLRQRDRLMQVVSDAEVAYWQLVEARKGLGVRERALVLTKNLEHIDEEKAKAGLLAKLDVLQAKASLAVREGDLLSARRDVAKAEDHLRGMLDPTLEDAAWDKPIEPRDEPTYVPRHATFEAAWRTAQASRPDLAVSVLDRERAVTSLSEANNHLFPKLDFEGGAGVTNLAGNFNTAVAALPSLQNYNLQAGVNLEWPLGATSDQDDYTIAKLRRDQADMNLRSTHQRAYGEVRDAVRDVEIDIQRVEATRLARELADLKLDAEQAKLQAGLSTNFEVLQFQSDAEQASLSEVEATIEYLEAQTRLEQVQGTLLAARGLDVAPAPKPMYSIPEKRAQ